MGDLNYSDRVMDHFLNPRNVGEIPDASGVGTVGNPICIHPSTLILLNPDVQEVDKTVKGSSVLSHDGYYHEVIGVSRRPYDGKVFSISVNNLGVTTVTPEHHILAIKAGKRDKFKLYKQAIIDWYSASELGKGDVVLYPIPQKVRDTRAIDLNINKPKWDFRSKSLPETIDVTENFCRLIGYFLAEGYVRTDKCKGTIGFVFNAKEKEYIQDVINLMQEAFHIAPADLINNRRKTASDVAFYSARLARFFEKNFGHGVYEKHLPTWAMYLPVTKQQAILCGLWRGDGYFDSLRQRAKYVTVSRQLAFQLRLLLLRQGIISNFSIGKAYGIHRQSYLFYIQHDESLEKILKISGRRFVIQPRSILRHKSWIGGGFFYTTIHKTTQHDYVGEVYNLEVDSAHSYVSNALTLHNCGDVMKMYLKIENDIIVDAKFKTYGCGAAISTSSMVTELVKGKTIEEALKVSNKAVAEALGGLPAIKLHCSVLAEQALRAALADYYKKTGKDPSSFEPKAHSEDEHGH